MYFVKLILQTVKLILQFAKLNMHFAYLILTRAKLLCHLNFDRSANSEIIYFTCNDLCVKYANCINNFKYCDKVFTFYAYINMIMS